MIPHKEKLSGDMWGGFAAMLVALPSAIAFGVTIYASIGPTYAGLGALAGILGATALGLFAPALGGTNRLITAPCAPAAAVLSAFAIESINQGSAAAVVVLQLTVVGLLTGILQILFGRARIGSFIKYIPYPVVSGYLSGVGIIIIGSQLPKFLGAPDATSWWQALTSPGLWVWESITVGAATMLVMLLAPRVTKFLPAAILGLIAGVLIYFGISLFDGSLLTLENNRLVIGALPGGMGLAGLSDAVTGRWMEIGGLTLSQLMGLFVPALTLAVLLSIDTLKTCVVLDSMTRSSHDSNRELMAQGIGNLASSCIGGMPGAGQMGATLVNLTSGGQTRTSGVFEGVFALLAFALLGTLIAWIPVAALAGILIIVGIRMIDYHSFRLLTSPWTVFDFLIIAAVVFTALTVSLIAASGTGIILTMLMYIREQLASTVIQRKMYGNRRFSRQRRSSEQMEILQKRGEQTVIIELQGSLFFGTKAQLYSAVEPEFLKRTYFILDMRKVQGLDVSVAHVLTQIRDTIVDRNGVLIFSALPQTLPNGRNIETFLEQMEITKDTTHVKVFSEIESALVWVEEQLLGSMEQKGPSLQKEQQDDEKPVQKLLELHEIELFKGRKKDTITALEACMEQKSFRADEKIYSTGDPGNTLYLIRRGTVRILMPLPEATSHHQSTYGRGDFFGALSFLDGHPRSNIAFATEDTDVFILNRKSFDKLGDTHKKLALNLLEAIALVLGARLRQDDMELATLKN